MTFTHTNYRTNSVHSMERTLLQQLFLQELRYPFVLQATTEKGTVYDIVLHEGPSGEYRRHFVASRASRKSQTRIEHVERPATVTLCGQEHHCALGYGIWHNRFLVFYGRYRPRISSRLTEVTFVSPLQFSC